jgi:hypothetical protein
MQFSFRKWKGNIRFWICCWRLFRAVTRETMSSCGW